MNLYVDATLLLIYEVDGLIVDFTEETNMTEEDSYNTPSPDSIIKFKEFRIKVVSEIFKTLEFGKDDRGVFNWWWLPAEDKYSFTVTGYWMHDSTCMYTIFLTKGMIKDDGYKHLFSQLEENYKEIFYI